MSVPLDQGGFGGWNLMLTQTLTVKCIAPIPCAYISYSTLQAHVPCSLTEMWQGLSLTANHARRRAMPDLQQKT